VWRFVAQSVTGPVSGQKGVGGPLVGHFGVLEAKGKPLVVGERSAADGLRFIGYDVRPSLIGYMAKQSKRMAQRIARELSRKWGKSPGRRLRGAGRARCVFILHGAAQPSYSCSRSDQPPR